MSDWSEGEIEMEIAIKLAESSPSASGNDRFAKDKHKATAPCAGKGRSCFDIPEALSEYLPSSCPPPLSTYILEFCLSIVVLTEPEMGPSWADFPLTLKLHQGQTSNAELVRVAYTTPLGAFDLTSRLAAVV